MKSAATAALPSILSPVGKTLAVLAPIVAVAATVIATATALVAQSAVLPRPPSFSATALQILPDGSEQVGRILKSGDNMRIEMQASVQIMRGGEGVAYLLDPQAGTYAEFRDASVARAVDGASDPCPSPEEMRAAQMSCRHTGEGLVSGIVTQSWELTAPGIQGVMRVEWDSGRRRALRREWPDATTMTLTFQSMQEVQGRLTEYWQTALQRPNQPAAIGGWWFDPELLVVVREEVPGGITRILRDIRVGPIDPALFAPPPGYRRVEPQPVSGPSAPAPPPGAGQ